MAAFTAFCLHTQVQLVVHGWTGPILPPVEEQETGAHDSTMRVGVSSSSVDGDGQWSTKASYGPRSRKPLM